jgi:hypothetical protein
VPAQRGVHFSRQSFLRLLATADDWSLLFSHVHFFTLDCQFGGWSQHETTVKSEVNQSEVTAARIKLPTGLPSDEASAPASKYGVNGLQIPSRLANLKTCHIDSTLFDHQAGDTAVDILQFEGEFSL